MTKNNGPRNLGPRKLLRAAIGVATISYMYGCDSGTATSGNLVAPPTGDMQPDASLPPPTSGNLVAPPNPEPMPDAGTPPAPDAQVPESEDDAGADDDAGAQQ